MTNSDIFNKSDFLNNSQEYFFESELTKAIQKARQICNDKGHDSEDAKVAWRIVEEWQAEFVYQRAKPLEQVALAEYLAACPDPSGRFLLDNWCNG